MTGDHTPVVQLHLRYGMILFIASEVMFFVAWFWAYFDAALFPAPCDHLCPHSAAGRAVAAGAERDTGMPAGIQAHLRSLGPAAASTR